MHLPKSATGGSSQGNSKSKKVKTAAKSKGIAGHDAVDDVISGPSTSGPPLPQTSSDSPANRAIPLQIRAMNPQQIGKEDDLSGSRATPLTANAARESFEPSANNHFPYANLPQSKGSLDRQRPDATLQVAGSSSRSGYRADSRTLLPSLAQSYGTSTFEQHGSQSAQHNFGSNDQESFERAKTLGLLDRQMDSTTQQRDQSYSESTNRAGLDQSEAQTYQPIDDSMITAAYQQAVAQVYHPSEPSQQSIYTSAAEQNQSGGRVNGAAQTGQPLQIPDMTEMYTRIIGDIQHAQHYKPLARVTRPDHSSSSVLGPHESNLDIIRTRAESHNRAREVVRLMDGHINHLQAVVLPFWYKIKQNFDGYCFWRRAWADSKVGPEDMGRKNEIVENEIKHIRDLGHPDYMIAHLERIVRDLEFEVTWWKEYLLIELRCREQDQEWVNSLILAANEHSIRAEGGGGGGRGQSTEIETNPQLHAYKAENEQLKRELKERDDLIAEQNRYLSAMGGEFKHGDAYGGRAEHMQAGDADLVWKGWKGPQWNKQEGEVDGNGAAGRFAWQRGEKQDQGGIGGKMDSMDIVMGTGQVS